MLAYKTILHFMAINNSKIYYNKSYNCQSGGNEPQNLRLAITSVKQLACLEYGRKKYIENERIHLI